MADYDYEKIKEEIRAELEAYLKPALESAIEARMKRERRARADIDADASSRGMLASSYVTQMKEREGDDREGDIRALESDYRASLAKGMGERLEKERERYEQSKRQSDQIALERERLAEQKRQFDETQRAKNTPSKIPGEGFSYKDYYEMMENMSERELKSLLTSKNPYWSYFRQTIISDIGESAYYQLFNLNYGRLRKSSGGGYYPNGNNEQVN